MGEIIARRQFDPLYIWLDIIFLLIFMGLLLYKKKYTTVVVGLIFGLVYMAVDYGIFHLLCHARSIENGYSLFLVLLWMSVSFGFTNFTWIWLWLSRDKNLLEWSVLLIGWWICCPLISTAFGGAQPPVIIQRTTGAYHGYMAAILIVGYLGLVIWNISRKEAALKAPILWLLGIGILAQFGWEAGLLIGGVRSAGFDTVEAKLATLVVNSLLETNLGMPYIYMIFIAYSAKFTEQGKRRKPCLTFQERIRENNKERVRQEDGMRCKP